MLHEKSLGSVKITSVDYEKLIKHLQEAAERIKKDNTVVKSVILFGSFARGNYTPFSDIDILVEVEQSDKPFLERRDEFVDYFEVPFDVNILVYTSEELDRLTAQNNLFLDNVFKQAKTLA